MHKILLEKNLCVKAFKCNNNIFYLRKTSKCLNYLSYLHKNNFKKEIIIVILLDDQLIRGNLDSINAHTKRFNEFS